jgi:hypothetical protein
VKSISETELGPCIPPPRRPDHDDLAGLNYRSCVALIASQPVGRVVSPTWDLPSGPAVRLVSGVGKLFLLTPSPQSARELGGRVVAVLVEDLASRSPGWEVLVVGPCGLVDYESRSAKRVLSPRERGLAVEMFNPAIKGRVIVPKQAPNLP